MKRTKRFNRSSSRSRKLREPQAHMGMATIRVNDPLAVGIEELKRRPFICARSRSSFIKPETNKGRTR